MILTVTANPSIDRAVELGAALAVRDRDRQDRAGDGAHGELPFGADVEEARAEGDGRREAGEHQRRRPRQRLQNGEARAGRAHDHLREDGKGRGPRRQHQKNQRQTNLGAVGPQKRKQARQRARSAARAQGWRFQTVILKKNAMYR